MYDECRIKQKVRINLWAMTIGFKQKFRTNLWTMNVGLIYERWMSDKFMNGECRIWEMFRISLWKMTDEVDLF